MALDGRAIDQPGIEYVVLVEFHPQSMLQGVVLRMLKQRLADECPYPLISSTKLSLNIALVLYPDWGEVRPSNVW